jgi:hypothetical protein
VATRDGAVVPEDVAHLTPGESLLETNSLPGVGFFGVGQEPTNEFYLMRAYKTTPTTGFVYWENLHEADLTGANSGFPPLDLIDIVIAQIFLRAAFE